MKFTPSHHLSLIVLLTLGISASANAVTIIMTTSGATGAALDIGTVLTSLPLTVDVNEQPGLEITVQSGSSFDSANSTVNGASGSFGVNAPTPDGGSENAARFDVDAAETLTIAFNEDVIITSILLTSFSGTETFSFGGVSFGDGDAPSNVYTFSGGGLSVSANNGIAMEAGGDAGASVGLVSITLDVVPEPASAMLLSLGVVGLGLRRRR